MKKIVVGILAMSVSTALWAAAPTFDGKRISRDVKELASDAYEGRGPATAGEDKTIAYLSAQFQAAACSRAATSRTASASGPRPCRCSAPTSSAPRPWRWTWPASRSR